MYHVYIDALEVETITPDFNDAKRVFNKYIRDYPTEVVDFDKLKNAVMSSISESGELEHDGRERVMQSNPN